MSDYRVDQLKLGHIFLNVYFPKTRVGTAIIYMKGGPSFGDVGKSPLAKVCYKNNVLLCIPDYEGYCRSDGFFTFKNCMRTIDNVEKFLSGKKIAKGIRGDVKVSIHASRIILIGSSWGGAMAPLYFKYYKTSIDTLALFKPITDWKSQGKTKYKEENLNETLKEIRLAWKHIYRGFENSEWPEIFKGNNSDLNPFDNTNFVKNKKIFICHGNKDEVVNWRKSKSFYDKLIKENNNKVVFKLFKGEGHTDKLNSRSASFLLSSLNISNN